MLPVMILLHDCISGIVEKAPQINLLEKGPVKQPKPDTFQQIMLESSLAQDQLTFSILIELSDSNVFPRDAVGSSTLLD